VGVRNKQPAMEEKRRGEQFCFIAEPDRGKTEEREKKGIITGPPCITVEKKGTMPRKAS